MISLVRTDIKMLHGCTCKQSSVDSYFNENDLIWPVFFIDRNKTLD